MAPASSRQAARAVGLRSPLRGKRLAVCDSPAALAWVVGASVGPGAGAELGFGVGVGSGFGRGAGTGVGVGSGFGRGAGTGVGVG